MARRKRQVIRIDEEKCDGCGLCVPSCKEGALRIVDGKARLVSEVYCDGLGACLGECPQGALTIEEREAEEFDERAVEKLARQASHADPLPCGCPGTMMKRIEPRAAPAAGAGVRLASELRQWPVQLRLVSPRAPYFKGADLVLMADCTAFASANVHRDFIRGRAIAIACPKLDDTGPYVDKLVEMIRENGFRSIEVVMMEVPCCGGLGAIAEQAIAASGVGVPLRKTILSLEGEVI